MKVRGRGTPLRPGAEGLGEPVLSRALSDQDAGGVQLAHEPRIQVAPRIRGIVGVSPVGEMQDQPLSASTQGHLAMPERVIADHLPVPPREHAQR